MSLWICEKGHHTGPGSEVACFICGAPTSRVEKMDTPQEVSPAQGIVIDDTDDCLGCQ